MLELSVQQFLESVGNPLTRKEYKHSIKKWEEYYGKSAEETLQERKDDLTQKPDENLIDYRNRAARFEKENERFHGWMLEHGYSINSARNLTVGIRQLFRYYQMPVSVRKGSRATKTAKTTRSFPMTIEHVRAMFQVADLRERVILSMATDFGLRISDFISLLKADLPDLSQEPPIFFEALTHKEFVVAHAFLSVESVDLLKVYLATLAEEKKVSPFLFPSNGDSHISDQSVNRILKGLAEKAKILLSGKDLSFHCFRKMFLAAAVDSGAGLVSGKLICGKKVSLSDDTYLGTVNLREKFKQIKKYLSINEMPKVQTEKVEGLENAVTKLSQELSEQKLISDTFSKQSVKLKPLLDFVAAFQSPEDLQRFLNLLKSSSVVSFPEHNIGIVNWEISPELKERLRIVAKAEGKTEDELIQTATREQVEKLEKQHRNKAMEK